MSKKQFKPLLTDRGKIECKVSIDGKYSLPLYWDSSDEYWYYYDQSLFEECKPIIQRKKISNDFKKDVLSNYANYPFSKEELEYILQFKKV